MTQWYEDAMTAADHLIGNLWFNLDALPLIAGQLEPDTMRSTIGGPASMAYSEMCRLMQSQSEQLSAGTLESGLNKLSFDKDWLGQIQARVLPESTDKLFGYAAMINNAADLRILQEHCNSTLKGSQGDTANAEALTAELMSKMATVRKSAAKVNHVSVGVKSTRTKLQDIRSGKSVWGALTGFADLDRIMRLVDSELIMFAGRPSQGKTQLALQVAFNRAQSLLSTGDGQVVVYSAEMSEDELIMRGACTVAGVNLERVTTNSADSSEWDKIESALSFIEMLPLMIDDTPSTTVDQVYYRTAMLNAQKRVKLVVADHTELFTAKADSETLRVDSIVKGFKGIAKTLDVPFIDIHQLGRDVENRADKQPMLSDMKYAGEAHADKVALIHRPEYYISRGVNCVCDVGDEEGVAIITLAKNRNGPVGRTRLAFVEKYAKFGDLHRERKELNDY